MLMRRGAATGDIRAWSDRLNRNRRVGLRWKLMCACAALGRRNS
jgi:hypothetical protein